MKRSRKILRVCLIFAVTLAAALGLVYYLYNFQEVQQISEGTLITCPGLAGGGLWR